MLKKVLEQGYNTAWSDSDVAWLENPFTMFDKAADLVLAWADNSEISQAVVYQHGEFAGRLLPCAYPWSRLVCELKVLGPVL